MDTHAKRISRSPLPERKSAKSKKKPLKSSNTETDGSDEEDSPESEQTDSLESRGTKNTATGASGGKKGGADWEIMDGLKAGQTCETKPDKFGAFLAKRRKWPMKGWHKRYFVLDRGTLTYAKSPSDIEKGKQHGSIDVGLSFVTHKRNGRRIDIDAEDLIYHLKAKTASQYEDWISRLRHHRLYRQHEMAYGTRDAPRLVDVASPELTPIASPVAPILPIHASEPRTRGSSFKRSSMERSQSKVATWLMDTAGMDQCSKAYNALGLMFAPIREHLVGPPRVTSRTLLSFDLNDAQSKIYELGTLLEKLYSTARSPHLSGAHNNHECPLLSNSLDRKEGRTGHKRWALKKGRRDSKKSLSTEGANSSSDLKVPDTSAMHTSSSNPNLLTSHESDRQMRPTSMPEHWLTGAGAMLYSPDSDLQARHEFLGLAKTVHDTLKSLSKAILTERERLKHAVEQEQDKDRSVSHNALYTQSLKTALAESVKQNAELRSRLNKINELASSGAAPTSPAPTELRQILMKPKRYITSVSHVMNSIQELCRIMSEDMQHPLLVSAPSFDGASISEFYDAEEQLLSSQESSEEDEVSSDVSDTEFTAITSTDEMLEMKHLRSSRRSRLPAPRPDTGDFSVWGLLRKNIGKDLSKISMPVSLNEPLSMLQRLCEELEYSDLLDRAAETENPYDRMVLIAAFSVSPYAATYYRAGQKPFNPLLGETYECIREDRGWRFIAEQVSHHPPISACYCDSKNFVFFQDTRIKTKFWGKSMEIQPIGEVTVTLPKWKDHYSWNKVTTCLHNIVGGSRWVDHYGECLIKNHNNGITCKLKYAKSSYWSEERHEVYGTVMSQDGKVVRHVSGKCNEGVYCGGDSQSAKCIWRPGAMPEDHELYYGFTKFALELNEIDREQVHMYAPTDTRFRPDQRYLEEGRTQDAEAEKNRLEQAQRERRRQRDEERVVYSPKWFMKDEDESRDTYKYSGKYWELRKDPGFIKMSFPKIW